VLPYRPLPSIIPACARLRLVLGTPENRRFWRLPATRLINTSVSFANDPLTIRQGCTGRRHRSSKRPRLYACRRFRLDATLDARLGSRKLGNGP
jgi:hypothetical protein